MRVFTRHNIIWLLLLVSGYSFKQFKFISIKKNEEKRSSHNETKRLRFKYYYTMISRRFYDFDVGNK